jgi:uncharacterized protein (TIGR03790 family)
MSWFGRTVALAVLCAFASPAFAQSGINVLVVANESAPGSVDIAERYASARGVPPDQVLRVKTAGSEVVSRAAFEETINAPVAEWLSAHSAQDRILYILLTRGMPLRIAGTTGRQGTAASVDSELTLLYRRMTGQPAAPGGSIANPYFLGDSPLDSARPFRRADHDIYLVTRLDGFSVDDALALIERGQRQASQGRILLDDLALLAGPRSKWLKAAAERLTEAGLGDRVVHETTSRPLKDETDVLGYYSWGSNDRALMVRHPNLTFAPGALAAMFLSTDARTFSEPPAAWTPGGRARTDVHGGSNQSLIADLVRSGVTGVAGQVSEPFISGAVRPDILFPAYLQGANLVDAFYLAIPTLSWQTVVVGDPLTAPFRKSASTDDLDPPLDAATELPTYFSSRRLDTMTDPKLFGASDAARRLLARAESRQARSDTKGAIEALTEAVRIEPQTLHAWQRIATLHENASRHAEAAEAYRQVLGLDRNDVIVLNNLAYHLAVRENKPEEALGLASRAATLGRGNALIEDTLGWIHHLLGHDQEALPYLTRASRVLTRNAEVQFHAAVVFAAVGRLEEAAKALDAAAALDPALAQRSDFQEVRKRIGR